jgi:hypothetical protein
MRVAFVTLEYPPFVIGGAGVYAAHVTEELANLGHQVVAITDACATLVIVIITNHCSMADVIDDRAWVVVPYDKDASSDTVLCILGDNEMIQLFSENGGLLVREQFNSEKITYQMEKYILEKLGTGLLNREKRSVID